MSWTDDRTQAAKDLWRAGHTASQIAARIGGVSRNAVISKLYREGLIGRGPARRDASERPNATSKPCVRQAASRTVSARPLRARPPRMQGEFVDISTAGDPPKMRRVPLNDLDAASCRWPIGNPSSPDFAFCGNTATPGFSYCEAHAAKAYSASAERRALVAPVTKEVEDASVE